MCTVAYNLDRVYVLASRITIDKLPTVMTQTTIALLVAQVVVQSKQPNSANIIISLENTKNYRRKDDGSSIRANAMPPCLALRLPEAWGKTAIIERVSLLQKTPKACFCGGQKMPYFSTCPTQNEFVEDFFSF